MFISITSAFNSTSQTVSVVAWSRSVSSVIAATGLFWIDLHLMVVAIAAVI
jgi:hypothetical protein